MQILVWLPEREHSKDAANALKEKVLVAEKNPQDYQRKEEKVRNRKSPTWRACCQTSGGWRGVLEMVQE